MVGGGGWGGLCVDVEGGNQRKCVNEAAYHHVTTEAAGFPGIWVCVRSQCACGTWGGGGFGGVSAGVMHGVRFQG